MPEPDLKKLFAQWLEELAIDATKKGTKAALLYNKALHSVKYHEGPIDDPKTLKQVQFVGDKTVKLLSSKLRGYCKDNGIELPKAFDSAPTAKRSLPEDGNPQKTRVKRPKRYIPRQRSGGYAILLALYLRDRQQRGLSKDEIIRSATPYCDKSFKSNPAANDFYSAWDAIKILMKHDLVACIGRSPKLYLMTDEGISLASSLKDAEGLQSSPQSVATDISFDNQIRVSPLVSEEIHFGKQSTPSHTPKPSKFSLDKSLFSSSPLRDRSNLPSSPKQFDVEKNMKKPNIPNASESHDTATSSAPIHDTKNRVFRDIRYDIWSHDEIDIILVIDNREIRSQRERDFFQQRLENLGVKCEVRSLAVGDTLWIAKRRKTGKEVVLNYICERKRLDDLAFSIKDGRFQEQKRRLKKTGMKQFYYLVEEVGIDKVLDMKDAIRSSISMTVTNSNFNVKRSRSIEHTINFLASLTNSIIDNIEKKNTGLIVLKPSIMNTQEEYAKSLDDFRAEFEVRAKSYECVHLFPTFQEAFSKTGMITVKEMFILMLMAIRGVSLERAITVQAYFKTPRNLIDFYQVEHSQSTDYEKGLLLMYIFKNQVGNKKIGKVVSQRIFQTWGQTTT